jgi:hypothetical protein
MEEEDIDPKNRECPKVRKGKAVDYLKVFRKANSLVTT